MGLGITGGIGGCSNIGSDGHLTFRSYDKACDLVDILRVGGKSLAFEFQSPLVEDRIHNFSIRHALLTPGFDFLLETEEHELPCFHLVLTGRIGVCVVSGFGKSGEVPHVIVVRRDDFECCRVAVHSRLNLECYVEILELFSRNVFLNYVRVSLISVGRIYSEQDDVVFGRRGQIRELAIGDSPLINDFRHILC